MVRSLGWYEAMQNTKEGPGNNPMERRVSAPMAVVIQGLLVSMHCDTLQQLVTCAFRFPGFPHLTMASMSGRRPQGSGRFRKVKSLGLGNSGDVLLSTYMKLLTAPGTPPAAASTSGETGLPRAQKS